MGAEEPTQRHRASVAHLGRSISSGAVPPSIPLQTKSKHHNHGLAQGKFNSIFLSPEPAPTVLKLLSWAKRPVPCTELHQSRIMCNSGTDSQFDKKTSLSQLAPNLEGIQSL
ncbi:unnamed protein product [Caretta caretta]